MRRHRLLSHARTKMKRSTARSPSFSPNKPTSHRVPFVFETADFKAHSLATVDLLRPVASPHLRPYKRESHLTHFLHNSFLPPVFASPYLVSPFTEPRLIVVEVLHRLADLIFLPPSIAFSEDPLGPLFLPVNSR
jgi:hypothetical protein